MQASYGADKLIVWPPCVLLENTGLGHDPETGKSIGLNAAEVRSAVSAVAPKIAIRRVVPVYKEEGHKGRYLVVFPDCDAGYIDAVALHDAFKDRKRGRDEWGRDERQEVRYGEKKKELYGYLVEPHEMKKLDRKKRLVRNWKEESFQEKVMKSQREKMKASEENQKIEAELLASVNEQKRKLAADEAAMDKRKAEIMAVDEEYAAEERRQEENRKRHEEQKKRMIDQFEAEKAERLRQFTEKEMNMRAEINKNLKDEEDEMARIRRENSSLESNIRVQQALAMADMRARTQVAIATEAQKGLDEIKTRHEFKLREMKERHLEERKKLLEERAAKKEAAWNSYNVGQEALDKEMETVLGLECQVCFEEFGPERPKVFYITCKHAKSCQPCADELWKKNHECPHCRTVQNKKPIKLFD
ncbi:vicilin-like seed storage protein At2g18540 [Selaginella moellendorffii]|uniref:vicilin-like seed storage protein At2g18540 n=1 Tax=Selaginella moellendorffii TaxID=88036 RepID=UPI000D1C5321|nr:vicilin-like seed storage protein At2g18540 [Selaginella moellendorffii]|eukprot:XP_024525141.1 vicilin-like seed storage protein At2g18540 [Selaginella moellendorffii]